jgi:hypothetical protein
MAVVGTFNRTNKLADAYQVAVDEQLMTATESAAASAALTRVGRALRQTRIAGRKAPRTPKTRSRSSRRGT